MAFLRAIMSRVSSRLKVKNAAHTFATLLALLSLASCGAEMQEAIIDDDNQVPAPITPSTPAPNSNPNNTTGGGGLCQFASNDVECNEVNETDDNNSNPGVEKINHATCGGNIRIEDGQMSDLFDGDTNSHLYFQDSLSNNDAVIHCAMPAGLPSFKTVKIFAPRERGCDLQEATLYIARDQNAGPMVDDCYLGAYWCIQDDWEEVGLVRDVGAGEGNENYAVFTSSSDIQARHFGLRFEDDSCNNYGYDFHLISEITVER